MIDDCDCPPECCPPDDYWPGYHEDPPEMTLLQWLDNRAIIGRILRRRPDEEEEDIGEVDRQKTMGLLPPLAPGVHLPERAADSDDPCDSPATE